MFYYHHQEDIFQDFSISIMLFLSQIFISFHIMTLLFAIREVLDKTTRKFSERTSIAGFHRYGIKANAQIHLMKTKFMRTRCKDQWKATRFRFPQFITCHRTLAGNSPHYQIPCRPLEQLHKKTILSYLRVTSSTESTQTGFNTQSSV